MSETYETVTVKRLNGITLSRIIWNRFRQPMGEQRVFERTLDRNPGLAEIGPILPLGTTFELVIPSPEETSDRVPVIRLYGIAT
jgi:phage tail protein X